ncbi:MAG: RNA polymerase sigma factor [Balneolales bacterium]|nr:RNA polymerase sigma factor [Balneolales bacterium]
MSKSEFTQLLKPHYNAAANYCRALCSGSSMAEAEEIMQQALLKAFENFEKLNDKEKFRSWLFQIITRCFYNAVRRPFWGRFVSLNTNEGEEAFQVFSSHYFEDNQILIAALSKLEKKERAALLLFEIGGFSIQEITKIQNEKSESAVKSRLSRTRKKLKEIMEQLQMIGSNGQSSNQNSILKSNDLYHETSGIINEYKSMG